MDSWDDPVACARAMRILYEPLHIVSYFSPEARAAFEQANLRGYWRGYFAGRAAPLGPVDAAPVVSSFYGFAPRMVARALPDVWSRATPQEALNARVAGAHAALTRLVDASDTSETDLEQAAALLRRAAEAAPIIGRPLAAANAALPWPDEPLDALWHAATLLREHRGDGHLAVLVVKGIDGCEANVWRAAVDSDRAVLQPARGWSDEEWDAAADRLAERGWLDGARAATETAHAAKREIEATTDTLSTEPWRALGAADTARLAALLEPLATLAIADLPFPNPTGLTIPPGT